MRREGFARAASRALQGALSILRPIGRGDIVIITGGVGDSARYRAWYVAEELRSYGFRAGVCVQDSVFLGSLERKFSVFIFHRVVVTPTVRKLIARIKEEKKEIIFDTDDLVFDPKYYKDRPYFRNMGAAEWQLYENGVGGEILADEVVRVCTAPTSFLLEKFQEHGKKTYLVPNKVSRADQDLAKKILANRQGKQEKGVTLGYFSGSATHNEDFATIAEPLANIFKRYPEVKLLVVGPLEIPQPLAPYADRITKSPLVSWEKHFERIAEVDINLAPLVIGDAFCEAKSSLKFFEAGLLAVPTVASRTRVFRETITEGTDGFTAATDEDWIGALSRLIGNPELRTQLGKSARETVLKKYVVGGERNESFFRYLTEILIKNPS